MQVGHVTLKDATELVDWNAAARVDNLKDDLNLVAGTPARFITRETRAEAHEPLARELKRVICKINEDLWGWG